MEPGTDIWTERLLIRPFVSDDLESMCAWMQDPHVTTFLGGVLTHEKTAERLASSIAAFERMQPLGLRAVTLGEIPRKAIGYCGLGLLPHSPERHVEIFAGLVRSVWGRGYATEAARAMLRLAFDTLGLRQVVATVAPDNERSLKLVTRLGFRRVGTMPWPEQSDVGLYMLSRPSGGSNIKTPWPLAH